MDLWHRGAILIIKKFKYLMKRGRSKVKWTFAGPLELDKEGEKVTKDATVHEYLDSTRHK